MDEDESTFDSFIVATDSRKRKSLLPINKTNGTDASDLDILEESGHILEYFHAKITSQFLPRERW